MLKNVWNFAVELVTFPFEWARDACYDFVHRHQKITLSDGQGGMTTMFSPDGVDAATWQKLLADKMEGTDYSLRDLERTHTAHMMHFYTIVDELGVGAALDQLRVDNPDIRDYMPPALLPLYGIYPEMQKSPVAQTVPVKAIPAQAIPAQTVPAIAGDMAQAAALPPVAAGQAVAEAEAAPSVPPSPVSSPEPSQA